MSDKSEPVLGKEMKQFIQDEIRRASDLPQDKLLLLFEPWIAPIQQAIEVLIAFRRSWEAWVEEHRPEILAISEILQKAAQVVGEFAVQADAASRRFELALKNIQTMAASGWTFPTRLSLSELIEFAELKDAALAEAYMLAKFESSDPGFEHIEERLLHDSRLADFRTVLPQCFRAIRQGDYAVAMPSLIAMLERVIIMFNPPHLAANTDVEKTLKRGGQLAREVEHDLLGAAVWLSLMNVVGDVWKKYPLLAPAAPRLSRPAIQHGRLEPPNSKVETWRLLNTLETALALHDQLQRTRAFQTQRRSPDNRQKSLEALLQASLFLPRGD
jgi:hypothetical protein